MCRNTGEHSGSISAVGVLSTDVKHDSYEHRMTDIEPYAAVSNNIPLVSKDSAADISVMNNNTQGLTFKCDDADREDCKQSDEGEMKLVSSNAFGIIKDVCVSNIYAGDIDKVKDFKDKDFSSVFVKTPCSRESAASLTSVGQLHSSSSSFIQPNGIGQSVSSSSVISQSLATLSSSSRVNQSQSKSFSAHQSKEDNKLEAECVNNCNEKPHVPPVNEDSGVTVNQDNISLHQEMEVNSHAMMVGRDAHAYAGQVTLESSGGEGNASKTLAEGHRNGVPSAVGEDNHSAQPGVSDLSSMH